MTLEEYISRMERFVDDGFGMMMRRRFTDVKGSSELGMLETPSGEEIRQIKAAVIVMSEEEKNEAEKLSDEQVWQIAERAGVDPAVIAIFINGYALERKRVSRGNGPSGN
jgi:hypothetical protein